MNASRHWQWLQRTLADTRWTLIQRLRHQGAQVPERRSMDEFCRAYWYPLFAFLRHKGYSHEEAQDHVQSFFAHLAESAILDRADPARGKLRNYLMTLVERHAASRHSRAHAMKRGGSLLHVPFDWQGAETEYQSTVRTAPSPEEACRRALAAQLVHRGIDALRAHYAKLGKADLCEALIPALEGPLQDATYDEVAARLGVKPSNLRMASLRFRERFRQILRVEAAALLAIPEGPLLDDEIFHLLAGEKAPPSV